MKALLIAEKPSLMREIHSVYSKHKKELPFSIDFTAQAGHLLTLKSPKEIDPELYGSWDLKALPIRFPYELKVPTDKRKLLNDIKHLVKSGDYDFIIHAGDPDQEGQLLISETLKYIGNKLPIKRFWSNDLTEGAILNALKNLKDNNDFTNLNNAALLRQHADYQFGMNATQGISKKYGELCQIGRVKAPIIRLIVDRELEIENYVEKITYKPAFLYKDYTFVCNKSFDKEEDALSFNPSTDKATVLDVSEKEKKQKAPKLFKLSTLQIAANKALHLSGQQTLQVLQALYESKAVTYPRSDCEYLSSNVDLGSILKTVTKETSIDTSLLNKSPKDIKNDKTYCNDAAIAKEGHTAIIPTGEGCKSSNDLERKLYELICRSFIAVFAKEKHTKTTKVTTLPDGGNKEFPYEMTETIDIDPGYEYILNPGYQKRKKINDITFRKNDILAPIEFIAKECKTTPPSRYNDGSLIKALDHPEGYEDEEVGKIKYTIGTPATRANIIEQCQKNGYFTKNKGSFYATDKGKAIVAAFKDISLFNITESAKWEVLLQSVRDGASLYDTEEILLKQMENAVYQIKEVKIMSTENSSNEIGKCPNCGAPILKGKFGLYCSNKCGMFLNKAYGKELTEKQIIDLLGGKKILLKGLTSKKGTKYDAYLTPVGVTDFEYNGKTGHGFKFEMSFPDKEK